ncbi:hypothetical protein COCC4DRAFT_190071 [Bipolaris maydis ATCC 48331]|uniref:Protein FAF1 n=2 Tax=Cochliobolus heterostrophus TaxID=5016 RepID=M2U272_COCH5|nr:uncharacterized protein COCC4DRAFT_190071 [Bipolaris maydis ATCC 48331]EMD92654.1 hypothetical protein COCHEDRAFT_1224428 [Bipolaris maydis C5]KAH7553060.1 hypothetical protein BM1_08033 [Bipolaris maydis]ENI08350.1 hypothetical protein COCC4DRAFT_190071 [Bipolaris maydis ATCC 48331]KAJ5061153.1 hypothetical protein J3E74DRAFT_269729 [Bipolaris maydis]KAJ6191767.1 hypothetical protein J3E72DRAFT_443242 [Bipolaris maydis]
MGPALGKRKRVTRAELERESRSPSPSSGSSDDSGAEDLQAVFRRAFEAKFKPLPTEPKKPKIEAIPIQEHEEEDEEESDWSGISDQENDVEVIEYHDPHRELDDTERAEMKAFMSSKPPTSASKSTGTSLSQKKNKKTEDTDTTEATNLKNDLALQKLLRESHLLSASSSGTSTPNTLTATGVDRHKSMDLHLQSLGAKGSIFTQKKMPMAQRKHMELKARTTEAKRRAEAREAGIVLERENKASVSKKVEKKRERGVGGPSIGKFRGGTLSLSKKDVRSITGGGGAKGKGKGKKGKR